jgi:hypothetical protein
MAKKSVAKLPARKQAPIPLRDVEITWTPSRDFAGGDAKPRTIRGAQLAWLLHVVPPREATSSWSPKDELDRLSFELEGFSELLFVLSYADFTNEPDSNAIFSLLYGYTRELRREMGLLHGSGLDLILDSGQVTRAPAAAKADDGKEAA